MGLLRSDFIVNGWKLPISYFQEKGIDLWDDKYLPYVEGHPGVIYTILRTSRYAVFGLMIAHVEEDGFDFVELPRDMLDVSNAEIIAGFEQVFGFKDEVIGNPKIFIFSNWN